MSSQRNQLRQRLRQAKFADEDRAVAALLDQPVYSLDVAEQVEQVAADLVTAARDSSLSKPLLDTFLTEYGLSNSEGVALMCLAESLLRIPDWDTADLLIADKLGSADWAEHAGAADSLLVNASTWALMLTGRIVELDEELTEEPIGWLKKLIARVSEPVVQTAVRSAMEILGREFVLGQTIDKALSRCQPSDAYSFDMLGEAARTAATAERYFQSYLRAIQTVGDSPQQASSTVSIKLSALHPRYEATQKPRVLTELLPRVLTLCEAAADAGLSLTVDAEEADRLDLSLDLFEALIEAHGVRNLGFVVQAYSKRAAAVLDWLIALAADNQCRFRIRLVKGAYWDAEVKHAQVEGLPGFPVFTRKESTDLSYLVCAQKIFAHPDQLYGQFATHNAHTLAAVLELGRGQPFEFQRLHGMGEILYATAREQIADFPSVRTYAPVGSHEDLLAYLVRRLLENGANSSFVNRFLDEDVVPGELVRDPQRAVAARVSQVHPVIRLPVDLFGERRNSAGVDLASADEQERLERSIATVRTNLLAIRSADADADANEKARLITAPFDRTLHLGKVADTAGAALDAMLHKAQTAQPDWNGIGGPARRALLERSAEGIEAAADELIGLLVNEAGKSIADAINEVREAVDFLRYYAAQIDALFADVPLPGPTGERNTLQLQGRGVWICISPWNFPLAIFLGQVSAALAAGNAVIAKPAEDTPLIARRCLELLHAAGIPADVCQLAHGGGAVGQALVEHPAVAGVAFTGSTETARRINQAMAAVDRPIAPLIAETGGQNAMIVDSTALLEQVTDDVLQSAFLSAGQRCSALRVLYLQDEVADRAIEMLIGAMEELTVGDPSTVTTDVGPVISEQAAAALQAHINELRSRGWIRHQLELDDSCANGTFVAPTLAEIPSITELSEEHFGPILHVIRFDASDIAEVIDAINSTGYGLTFGLHTRIDARAGYVAQQVSAGNLYVNRNMIGAVVGSQPFGGHGRSGTGPKAGGPHYLARFATEKVLTVNTVATGGNAELLNL